MNLKDKVTLATASLGGLLEYANNKTGADDENIGDAIKTLVDGFGSGGIQKIGIANSSTETDYGELDISMIPDEPVENHKPHVYMLYPNADLDYGTTARNSPLAFIVQVRNNATTVYWRGSVMTYQKTWAAVSFTEKPTQLVGGSLYRFLNGASYMVYKVI